MNFTSLFKDMEKEIHCFWHNQNTGTCHTQYHMAQEAAISVLNNGQRLEGKVSWQI